MAAGHLQYLIYKSVPLHANLSLIQHVLTWYYKTGVTFVCRNSKNVFIWAELHIINDAACLVSHVSFTCAALYNISVNLKNMGEFMEFMKVKYLFTFIHVYCN